MTLSAAIVVFALMGILFLIAAARRLRRRRVVGGLLSGAASLVLFLIAAGALLVAANLRSFQRMSAEELVGHIQFTRLGYHQFNGVFTSPTGERSDFALRGDEWQVDAHMLKWRALASLIGFDAVYRLDRISGRYTRIDDERNLPRTVYPLSQSEHIDLWQLVQSHQAWIPWVDALYGTATFLPMADGAVYDIKLSKGGLMARPANPAAREAVGNWHGA